jgi:hypothetical protein
MAILKTLKGNRIGSTIANYWIGGSSTNSDHNFYDHIKGNNYALVEDPLSNTLYFPDSSNDSVNMNPNFSKEIPFRHLFSKNISHAFSSKLLYTPNSPRMIASYNNSTLELDEEIHSTQYTNYSFRNNLDLQQAYENCNYKQFQIGNENFYLFVIPDRSDNGGSNQSTYRNTAPQSAIILAHGSTLDTATFIYHKSTLYSFDLLSVNKEEQIIYLSGLTDTYRNASDGEFIGSNYSGQVVLAIPFNITSLDGVFSFGSLKVLFKEQGSYYSSTGFKFGYYYSISYIGRDNNDKDCFLASYNNTVDAVTQRVFKFFKIDYTQFQTETTLIGYSDSRIEVLDCFEIKTITVDTDPSNTNHYANQFNTIPSKFYNFDAAAPNSLWSYLPLFKNNGNCTLAAIHWDKSQPLWSDNFTLHQDLLSGADLTSEVQNPYPIISNLSNTYGAANESYYTLFLSNTNKLTLAFNYRSKPFYDDVTVNATTKFNNFLTYSVDVTDPTDLTYENTSQIPALSSMILKDPTNNSYQELFVLSPSSHSSYFYTSQNGWAPSYTENIQISEVVFDNYNRRWALEHSPLTQFAPLIEHGYMYLNEYDVKLHLLSQILPYTTSIEFQNTNITYTNVDINNNLIVNAYDSQGNRIQIDVLVNIEGSNIEFASSIGGGTSTVVTTSPNTDTSVPVVITGPGYANVSASYDV